jgi:hypothetical protein
MKDSGLNFVFAIVSGSFTLPVLAKGLDCIIDARAPGDILKGCLVVLTAFGMGYGTYKIIKDKDI